MIKNKEETKKILDLMQDMKTFLINTGEVCNKRGSDLFDRIHDEMNEIDPEYEKNPF